MLWGMRGGGGMGRGSVVRERIWCGERVWCGGGLVSWCQGTLPNVPN